jgi:hypothetical protein
MLAPWSRLTTRSNVSGTDVGRGAIVETMSGSPAKPVQADTRLISNSTKNEVFQNFLIGLLRLIN